MLKDRIPFTHRTMVNETHLHISIRPTSKIPYFRFTAWENTTNPVGRKYFFFFFTNLKECSSLCCGSDTMLWFPYSGLC